jgi:hypothetical protein
VSINAFYYKLKGLHYDLAPHGTEAVIYTPMDDLIADVKQPSKLLGIFAKLSHFHGRHAPR